MLKAISNYHGYTGSTLGHNAKELKEIRDLHNKLTGLDKLALSDRGAKEYIRAVKGGKFDVAITPRSKKLLGDR